MELKLEISEGSKYNNLINEIELEFKETYQKAINCKNNNHYEKMIRYLEKCIVIDPDNKNVKYIKDELIYYVNQYLFKLYELGYYNYYDYNFDISKFYLTKSYCLLREYEKYINKKNKYLDEINYMLQFIENKSIYYKVKDIHEINLQNIKI